MVVLAYSIASEICFEKNAGLLEFLFIAGVKRSTVKTAWFIFGLIFFLLLAVILALIIKYINANLIEHTPLSVLLVFLMLYCTALLCLCFLVSSLVATAQQAGIVMFVLLLIAYLAPNWAQIVPSVGYTGGKTWTARIASLIHCGVTVQIGFAYIIKWETIELGAQWATLSDSPVDGDEFGGLLECCIHLIIQIVYYMLLSVYFDLVAPSKYGFKLPWYFPFSPAFWRGSPAKVADINAQDILTTADIEPLKSPKEPGISVMKLTKSYGRDKIAVDRLSVNFYRNEITAVCHHWDIPAIVIIKYFIFISDSRS
jgi:ABC-type transport system involved in multi-copper enzyme maturation permease subunit